MIEGGAGADWRPLVAALANPDARAEFARIALGLPADPSVPTTKASRRALDTLTRAGLIVERDGALVVNDVVFAAALRAQPARPVKTGPERFLDADGRIDRYPSNLGERRELLALIAERALHPGEVLDERTLTERLTAFSDDPAALRRYLVDLGLLERTRSGSEYALPPTP